MCNRWFSILARNTQSKPLYIKLLFTPFLFPPLSAQPLRVRGLPSFTVLIISYFNHDYGDAFSWKLFFHKTLTDWIFPTGVAAQGGQWVPPPSHFFSGGASLLQNSRQTNVIQALRWPIIIFTSASIECAAAAQTAVKLYMPTYLLPPTAVL